MANTVTAGQSGVTVVFDGSTAWDSSTLYPSGIDVDSLEFIPAVATDIISVRDTIDTGRVIFQKTALSSTVSVLKHFTSKRKLKLYVVGNQVSANSTLIIEKK